MSTSWFSITFIKETTTENLVFTGYLAVDKYTTLVKGFYDSNTNNMLKPGNTTFNNGLLFNSTELQEEFDTTSSDFKFKNDLTDIDHNIIIPFKDIWISYEQENPFIYFLCSSLSWFYDLDSGPKKYTLYFYVHIPTNLITSIYEQIDDDLPNFENNILGIPQDEPWWTNADNLYWITYNGTNITSPTLKYILNTEKPYFHISIKKYIVFNSDGNYYVTVNILPSANPTLEVTIFSWYSISISNGTGQFNGYFSVDDTNLVTGFYETIDGSTNFENNLLGTDIPYPDADNSFENNNFTYDGINIKSDTLKNIIGTTNKYFNLYKVRDRVIIEDEYGVAAGFEPTLKNNGVIIDDPTSSLPPNISWYSISIYPEGSNYGFHGYFSVNNYANLITGFYETIHSLTNFQNDILGPLDEPYYTDNLFLNNRFSNNGTNITSPTLNNIFNTNDPYFNISFNERYVIRQNSGEFNNIIVNISSSNMNPEPPIRTISWYSISIDEFHGYFSVDNYTHLVNGFYETINGLTDFDNSILGPLDIGSWISDNLFRLNRFSDQTGLNITSYTLQQIFDLPTPQCSISSIYGIVFNSNNDLYYIIDSYSYVQISLIPDFIPISNVCFPAGVPITTNQGNIPIEKINPIIHTIRNKKIVGITKTITQDKYLVCFEKDALGNNIPSQKTIISKNHYIFYKNKMREAREFIGINNKVYKIKYTGEILYNVLMEEHNKMLVNNLICETLHPENGIAKLYRDTQELDEEEQYKLIKTYNELAIKNKIFTSKKLQ